MSVMYAIMHDLPGHLVQWSAQFGPCLYLILFAIIFAETGLIVMPFLPGDSLLFALGALTSATQTEGVLNFWVLLGALTSAAILGDAVNYAVGRWLGMSLFKNPHSKFFNPRHLARAQKFYDRHGGRTIILARFIPIIRTYAPFVAGLGKMKYADFFAYNLVGGAVWIALFLTVGREFGNLPQVKSNFHLVIGGIILVSVLPVLIEFIRSRSKEIGT